MPKRMHNSGISAGPNKAGTCDSCDRRVGCVALYDSGRRHCPDCHKNNIYKKEKFICYSIENKRCIITLYNTIDKFGSRPTNAGLSELDNEPKLSYGKRNKIYYKLKNIELTTGLQQGYRVYVL